MNILHKKYFVFDMDGTLVDSSPKHKAAFDEVLVEEGAGIILDYEDAKGKKTRDVFTQLGFEGRSVEILTRKKQERYRTKLASGEVELFSGVIPALELLIECGRKVFICTGASRRTTEQVIDDLKLRRYLDGFITGCDVSNAKPNPEILMTLLNRYSLAAEDSVLIEDSKNGRECGLRAGVDVVMVNGDFGGDQSCYESFNDFFRFVQRSIC